MYIFLGLICVVVVLIVVLKKFAADSTDTHEKIRSETSNKIAKEEAERARLYDEKKSTNEESAAPAWWPWPDTDFPSWAEVIEVDAFLIMKNLHQRGEDVLVLASKYFPELSIFHGVVMSGGQTGLPIEINIDYEKEAIHPDTKERIPGIKRYLRQHAVKSESE